MATVKDIVNKQTNSSGPAAGSSMENSTPTISKNANDANSQVNCVTRNQMFTLKSVKWNAKSPSGY